MYCIDIFSIVFWGFDTTFETQKRLISRLIDQLRSA
jgi:hypothetical protein